MDVKEEVQNGYDAVLYQNNLNPKKQKQEVCNAIFDPIKNIYPTFDGYLAESDLGLGCGFPFQFINLSDKDAILDLGCATGIDCFIMAAKMSNESDIVGVDLTESLIIKANEIVKKNNIKNVNFLQADIENLAFENHSKNIITSNGVLSLVPNLTKAFASIYDVLKPGGQFCFSDINKKTDFTATDYQKIKEYTGCLNGIRKQDTYLNILEQSGFKKIEIVSERIVELSKNFISVEKESQLYITTFKMTK